MLEDRLTLAGAFFFAFISAVGVGAGLVSVMPILKVLLHDEGGHSLAAVARDHNATEPFLRVPDWIVTRLPEDPFAGVVLILSSLIVLTLFGATANFLHVYLTGTTAARTVARIRQEAFDHALRLPLVEVIAQGPSQHVARIVRDAAELQKGFVALTSKTVAHLFKGTAAFIVAVSLQPVLTFAAIPTLGVIGIVLRKVGKRVRRGTRGSLRAQEGMLRVTTESMHGLRSIKAGTAEADASARFAEINDQVLRHELRIRTARALSSPAVEALAVVVLVLLALGAAKLIIDQKLQLESFVATLAALGLSATALRPLANFVTEIQAASAPATRLCEILDANVEEPEPVGRPKLAPFRESIALEDVHFAYPGASEAALRGIDLTIRAGERVALVGPNGSGKTTLASLLPRLLVPTEGRILVDGVDTASVAMASLRGQVGVVTQEPFIVHGTISQNIAFGLDATPEAIASAAERARASDFIERLPGGYDSVVGEHGATLSGGQRQRLAIARIILREPSIVILDEATSQVDAESEAQINAALDTFCKGRTVVVIAHRLSTVRHADRIVVMEAGTVVDDGGHDALLERCPLYRRLTETQLVA